MTFKVRMYGQVKKTKEANGLEKCVWEGGQLLMATAYDMPITGFNTFNANNLRLWRSRPYDEYEESMYQGEPDYYETIDKASEMEYITSIFYPNDKVQGGKELRLKQQYFFAAATLQDLCRRFKKLTSHNF